MRIWLLVLLAAGAACTVELPDRAGPAPAAGSPVTVDPATGALDVDPAKVPILADGTPCEAGQVLARAEAGWECQTPVGEVGEHHHDGLYYGKAEVYTRAEVDAQLAAVVPPLAAELAEARAGADSLADRLAELETRLAEVEAQVVPGLCPTLFRPDGTQVRYERSTLLADEDWIICVHEVADRVWDQLVRVGDFWIDRHEMSSCDVDLVWGLTTGNETEARACSVPGMAPQTGITWFQAAAACANAGKQLCTNAEWQTAVSGTPDPGVSDGTDGACRTDSADGPRVTGRARGGEAADDCVSRFGVEDMIGNVAEWVSDWGQAGKPWQGDDGQTAPPCPGVASGPWPPGYGEDRTANVDGRTSTNPCGWQSGLPAAVQRGGTHTGQAGAGAFSYSASSAPAAAPTDVGARCCVGSS